MKAAIDGTVVADAPQSDLILIEGNYYFPPSSLRADAFSDSPTPYTCPWKGVAQYHDISVGRLGPPRRGVELSRPVPGVLRPGRQGLLRLFRLRQAAGNGGRIAMTSPDPGLPRNIGAPATRALVAAGYTRLSQLANAPAAELGKLHGVGPKALRLLQEALKQQGLSLG